MLLDERDNVEHLLTGRLKASHAVGGDNKLVATHTLAFIVQSDIRRIAQAITSVQLIACVLQYVLDVNAMDEIIVCQIVVPHCYLFDWLNMWLSKNFRVFCEFRVRLISTSHLRYLSVSFADFRLHSAMY